MPCLFAQTEEGDPLPGCRPEAWRPRLRAELCPQGETHEGGALMLVCFPLITRKFHKACVSGKHGLFLHQ